MGFCAALPVEQAEKVMVSFDVMPSTVRPGNNFLFAIVCNVRMGKWLKVFCHDAMGWCLWSGYRFCGDAVRIMVLVLWFLIFDCCVLWSVWVKFCGRVCSLVE